MIPGRATRHRQRPHQAPRARERRAQRGHVLGRLRPSARITDAAGYHATYSRPTPGARTTASTIVGWDDAYPARQLPGRCGGCRRQTARSSCATAGATAGATAATSGSPTTTGRSPASRGSAATAARPPTPCVEDTRQLRPRLPVRQARRHRPLGLRQHPRAGAPTGSRRRRRRRSPPPASTRSPPSTRYEVWAGRTLRVPQPARLRHRRAAGLHHRAALDHACVSTPAGASWSPSS